MSLNGGWSSAISPQRPPVPRSYHWLGGLVVSMVALSTSVYMYARSSLPEPISDDEVVESMIVALGAPAQRLEPPPPPPPDLPPPEPEPPTAPTERADDAPPPEPPPQPRPVIQPAPDDGRLSSGFGTGTEPAPPPPPPPPPPVELRRDFIDMSTAQYVSRVSYPYEALRRRHQGIGHLLVTVDRQGNVRKWKLVKSTGHITLDREIQRIAKQVDSLDPLPAYYDRQTASFIVPFHFIMSES